VDNYIFIIYPLLHQGKYSIVDNFEWRKQIIHFPRALGRPAASSLSDESVLFACGETMLKRFHKLRKIIYLLSRMGGSRILKK